MYADLLVFSPPQSKLNRTSPTLNHNPSKLLTQAIGDRAAFATIRYSNALWGRLAAIILTEQWHLVREAVDAIDKHIMTVKRREDGVPPPPADADPEQIRSMSDREKLQLRTWLLHWSLFSFPVTPDEATKREAAGDKWENVLELIFPSHDEKQQGPGNGPDRYRQALQNNAPWLLRYVTTMVRGWLVVGGPMGNQPNLTSSQTHHAQVILNKKPMAERFRSKQHVVKEVVWLIEQEAGAYQVSQCFVCVVLMAMWMMLCNVSPRLAPPECVRRHGDLWC